MGKLWWVAGAAVALCLTACTMDTDVHADANPKYAVNRAEPMFVAYPEKPSMRDPALAGTMRDEMQRSGLLTVDAIENARWVIAGSNDGQEFNTAAFTPFGCCSHGESDERTSFYLVVYPAEQYRNGDHLPAWAGSITANSDEYADAPDAIMHALMGLIGQNLNQHDYQVDSTYQDTIHKPQPQTKPVSKPDDE